MRTLLRGGNVYTPVDLEATAMATDGDSVVFVGSDDAAATCAGGAQQVIELDGALVTPAFVDAHVHTTSTGLALGGLHLAKASSLAAALDAVERHCRSTRGGVVLGHGWDETRWPERRPPTRQELDRASYGGVVYLSRIDVHSSVVSSALLAAAPEARGESGFRDDGLLTREAHHVARRVAREALTADQRRDAQRATRRRAAEVGIGCYHELAGPDISGIDDLREVLELAAAEPGPEVLGYWGELGGAERARELGTLGAAGDLFADGSIGSRTAALRTVYADADHTGHAYLTAAQVRDHVTACTRAGLQAGFHAIGDGALEAVIAGCAEAAAQVGSDALRAARHRIEHAEMLDQDLLARFAELGLIASVQPAFDAAWGGADGMYAERLGAERALTLNPFAAMAAAGIPLALGSDSPVTPLDPWGTVRAAVHHHNPAHRLSAPAAFAAHTRGGWRAAGDDDGGVLAPRAPATYAVWRTADSRAGLPALSRGDELPTCLRTVVRGNTVFDAGQS
jgi:predicted amidohydrolase YtcJ